MRLSALRFVLLILLAGLVLSSCAAAELVTEDDDSLIFLSIDALSDPALDSEEETDDEEADDPSFSMEMNNVHLTLLNEFFCFFSGKIRIHYSI